MSDEPKLTLDEVWAMFGDTMPMAAVSLILAAADKPDGLTGARDALKAMAEAHKAPTTHRLKCLSAFFAAVMAGTKTFLVRRDDRHFKVGDVLVLMEWLHTEGRFTGIEVTRRVTYKLGGGAFGIEPGYCVLGLAS